MVRYMRSPTVAMAVALLVVGVFMPATHTMQTLASASDAPVDTISNPTTPANDRNSSTNYNCPTDCQCVLAHNTHQPLLHARCTSLNGLLSEEPLQSALPIHSIDLSYLHLSRLSHSLEKLRDVTSVDLSHNELHEIGHLGRRIKKLNLKHNRITSAKLAKLPQHVQVLNLQHNDVTHLPLEFTKLTNLQTLELSHNQINCTCETLEVRNWLQERHVFMESPVTCSYPVEYRGKSWLQVKQADVCDKEKRGWSADEEANELMLADQPFEGSSDNDEEEEDELGKAYLPIENKSVSGPTSAELRWNDVEGSGDLGEMNMPLQQAIPSEEPALLRMNPHDEGTTVAGEDTTDDGEDDDGSGSGGGIFMIPQLARHSIVIDTFDAHDSSEVDNDYDVFDNRPMEKPAAEATQGPEIFGAGMGIFDNADKNSANTDSPVQEEVIVPVVHHETLAGNVPDDEVSTSGPEDEEGAKSDAVKTAKIGKDDDSNATYLLLGVIALIVIGLILFVGIKRCKQNRNAAHDPENPRQTEMLDMDKKNLGKPLQRNGNEHAPLIGEKTKSDLAKPINGAKKTPYDAGDARDGTTQQQPLLKGDTNGSAPNETATKEAESKLDAPVNNEQASHEYYPITPRYPTPKSPRASKYAQYPPAEQNNNNNVADNAYLPSSPKSGRYSPVYSPETGRVKIKLTETPKPKTPMLVTRSRSNAGDIITTPVQPGIVPPVGGTANGHMNH